MVSAQCTIERSQRSPLRHGYSSYAKRQRFAPTNTTQLVTMPFCTIISGAPPPVIPVDSLPPATPKNPEGFADSDAFRNGEKVP